MATESIHQTSPSTFVTVADVARDSKLAQRDRTAQALHSKALAVSVEEPKPIAPETSADTRSLSCSAAMPETLAHATGTRPSVGLGPRTKSISMIHDRSDMTRI